VIQPQSGRLILLGAALLHQDGLQQESPHNNARYENGAFADPITHGFLPSRSRPVYATGIATGVRLLRE
jgi:hypothetical protein